MGAWGGRTLSALKRRRQQVGKHARPCAWLNGRTMPGGGMRNNSSYWKPHQRPTECTRRLEQIAYGRVNGPGSFIPAATARAAMDWRIKQAGLHAW